MIILNETLILGEFCNSWPLKFKILKITDHSKDSLLQSPPPKMNSALLNLPPPPPTCDWPARLQTSYFIGPYNLHYLLFSGIGALLCHHPYCFPSQSQIFIWNRCRSAPKMNLPLPISTSLSNMNLPPLTKTIHRPKNVNRRSRQIVIRVWHRTLYKVLHDVREMIVSVIKYLQKCLVNIFLMCFDLETLKPAL